jgi:hypothetical protein
MANITIDSLRIDNPSATWSRFVHRLRVLARARRIGRLERARSRLVWADTRDVRMFADVGIDAIRYRHFDGLAAMIRPMAGH